MLVFDYHWVYDNWLIKSMMIENLAGPTYSVYGTNLKPQSMKVTIRWVHKEVTQFFNSGVLDLEQVKKLQESLTCPKLWSSDPQGLEFEVGHLWSKLLPKVFLSNTVR